MRSIAWATSVAVLALILGGGARARAQDVELPDIEQPCAPEVTEHRREVLARDGVPGIWFRLEVAQCMLGRLAALPRYVERVRLLEGRLDISDHRTELLRRQVILAEQEAEQATGALTAAERQAREGQEAAQTERDLRWLWLGLGVVLVVVVEGLALWAFSQLHI